MKRWELVACAVLLALVLAFELARELYLDSHARREWSAPGTFDPSLEQ